MLWPRRFHRSLTTACTIAILLVGIDAATGQTDPATIIPVSQRRWTQTDAVISQCAMDGTDGFQAVGFEPFDSTASLNLTCADASAVTTVVQQSQINATSITASGSLSASVAAGPTGLMIVLADTMFEVTFSIASAVNFTLDGLIAADATGAFAVPVLVFSDASLTRSDGTVIFSVELAAGAPDQQLPFAESGVLEPGTYTLKASTNAVLDEDVPPHGTTDAAFDLLLQIQPLSPCAAAASFIPLGDLPGGRFSSGAVAVSADGASVLGQGTLGTTGNLFRPDAFLWTEESGMVGLGSLPGGSDISVGTAISPDGSVIVGASNSSNTDPASANESFRWTKAGGMVGLGDLPGGIFASSANFVSDDGLVVVGSGRSEESPVSPGGANEPFRWTEATGMVGLGSLPGGFPAANSLANAMSADGSVIVGRATSGNATSGGEAFRWTQAGGMAGLGDLPGGNFQSEATAVSADGSVVAGQSRSEAANNALEVFRWTAETGMVGLGTLPGASFEGAATAVSADGSVIVGFGGLDLKEGTREAFRWTAETGMIGLGDLPGDFVHSAAVAVSADGSIVVGIGCTEMFDMGCDGPEAFIWDELNGLRNLRDVLVDELGLDLTGWTLTSVTDMTPDGRTIVGTGTNPNGDPEAWIAILGEPAGACCSSPLPARPDSVVATNRYLSFTEGAFGTSQAVRVTFASLPPPFDLLNGTSLWVGDPRDVSENGGAVDPIVGFPNFKAATLQCQPFFTDWSALGTVHVFHEGIVPGGIYNLQAVDASCPLEIDAAFSPPLMITTAEWGDVAGEFDQAAGAWTAPNGVVAVIADVVAILDKFASRVGAPSKARADLEPALPDQTINITDVVSALNAFGGRPFPFTPNLTPCGP